jgi:hypothetical protein
MSGPLHPAIALALALAAVTAAAACSQTEEERRFEALARTCAGLGSGATSYADAQAVLSGSYPAGPFCSTALAAMPEGDGCGAAAPGREVCQVFRVWFSSDSRACPNGRCTCELRLLRSALDASGEGAPVCGARFDKEGAEP